MDRKRIKIDLLIHDLKVPLAVVEATVSGILERTDTYGPLTEKQKKALNRALRNTRMTRQLVCEALELSRSREGITDKKPCRISFLIKETLGEVFDFSYSELSEKITGATEMEEMISILETKGIGLEMDPVLWKEKLTLDDVKVRQILRNLLMNALKYRKKRIDIVIMKWGDRLKFSVSDDGRGIPPEYHEKIFQSYFQLDDTALEDVVRGHGLGLAGVLALVEDMKGEMELQSDKGKGARFTVYLPLT